MACLGGSPLACLVLGWPLLQCLPSPFPSVSVRTSTLVSPPPQPDSIPHPHPHPSLAGPALVTLLSCSCLLFDVALCPLEEATWGRHSPRSAFHPDSHPFEST